MSNVTSDVNHSFLRALVVQRARDARVEGDVPTKVEAIHDVVGSGEPWIEWDISPSTPTLAPAWRGVCIPHALNVAKCTRISVPEPRPAHAAAPLYNGHAQPHLTELVQHVE